MKKVGPIFFSLYFGSVTLPCSAENLLQVYQQAKQNNTNLRAAAAQRDAALQKVNQARGALLPQLGLEAGYQLSQHKQHSPQHDRAGSFADGATALGPGPNDFAPTRVQLLPQHIGGHSTTRENKRDISLQLEQSIIDFAKWRRLSIAEKEANMARVKYQLEQQKLIFNTAKEYIQVLSVLQHLELLTAARLAGARKLEEFKQGFEVGYKDPKDFFTAQTDYDYILAKEVEAQGQLGSAMEKLSQITGQRYVQLNALEPKQFKPQQPSNVTGLIKKGEQSNLELLHSRLKQNIAREGMKLAQTGHLPSLNFSASAGHAKSKTKPGYWDFQESQKSSRDVTGRVTFKLPLFSGGAVCAAVKEKQYQLVEASEQLEAVHRATVSEVRTTHSNLINNIKCNTNYQNALISSQKLLTIEEARFQAGTNTMVDILNARNFLFRAKSNLSKARFDYLIDLLGLKQATGELTEQDLHVLNAILKVPVSVKPAVTEPHTEKKLAPPQKRSPAKSKRPLKKQPKKQSKAADFLVLHRQ